MNQTLTTETFADFPHPAKDIRRYIHALGRFTLLMQDGAVIHYRPQSSAQFLQWLELHEIPDVRML